MLHCNRNFFLLCSSDFLLFNIIPSCLSLSPWDKRHNLFPLSSEYMAFFFLPSKLVQSLNDFCCCSWNSPSICQHTSVDSKCNLITAIQQENHLPVDKGMETLNVQTQITPCLFVILQHFSTHVYYLLSSKTPRSPLTFLLSRYLCLT